MCVRCVSPLCPQVMQGSAWVVSTVLLKFLLSTVLGAADDVRRSELTCNDQSVCVMIRENLFPTGD